MLGTLPLNELEKYTENVYEAIIVIAKRARQINEEQKKLVDDEEDYNNDNDDYIEDEFDRKNYEYNREKYHMPKPTTIALEEFMSGKLDFEYSQRKPK